MTAKNHLDFDLFSVLSAVFMPTLQKKEIAYTLAFTVTLFFSMYMLADLFGVLPPGFIEQLF